MSSSTNRTPKRADVYRYAAECLVTGERHGYVNSGYSCIAINIALAHLSRDHYDMSNTVSGAFRSLFEGDFGDPDDEGNKRDRILALCFMAAMVEAGDA